jgi:DNA-binding NarL/FixJ family response regulator
MKKITLLLVEDHTIVRQGLRSVLETAQDIDIVGDASDGRAAVIEAFRLKPDVVLMDIAMPRGNGIDAAKRISAKLPQTRVLILSTYHDDSEVHAALDAGASGYVMKETAGADLIKAVRECAKGNSFFSPVIAQRMLRRARLPGSTIPSRNTPLPVLTPREIEVLQLIAQGKMNKEVADALGISVKTVEKHRQSLMDKLNIREAASLTRYAIARGMIACDRPRLVPSEETPSELVGSAKS